MKTLHLDYETYSELDITKVGAFKYAMHGSTEVLMASWCFEDGYVQHWDATQAPMPDELADALCDPSVIKKAFNATFEYLITQHVLKIPVDISEWRCVMAHAWSLSFSGGLAQVMKQIGFPEDRQKLASGRKLINRFSKPAPKNHKADRYDRFSHPAEWQEFCDYKRQDTVAEHELDLWLSDYPMPEHEQKLWELDFKINERGVPVDLQLVDDVQALISREKARLKQELVNITGLENPLSGPQFIQWLQWQGINTANLRKDTVANLLAKEDLDSVVRHALVLRAQATKTSTAKFSAFKKAVCDDGRVRGMFQYAGAQRTKRWAGRIVQLHNLPQGRGVNNPAAVADTLDITPLDTLRDNYTDLMTLFSALVRPVICAPPGRALAVSDLSSIESRVLGYLSGCKRINAIFAGGKDTYKDFAMELYRIRYEDVTKAQRTFAKPPTLGCGYMLGAEGLIKYAESLGVSMTFEQAQHAVNTYRETYPEVVAMWYWLVEAVTHCIQHGSRFQGYGVRIRRDDKFLFIDLPSGRSLSYYQPQIIWAVPPWGKKKVDEAAERGEFYEPELKQTISYMGLNSFTNQWQRITTHGGKLTENIVQAVARDILAEGMVSADKADMDIILHVHDEIGVEYNIADGNTVLHELENIMSVTPDWLPAIKLGAEGYTARRYRKD